jgi:hypothetical protein
MGPLDINPAFLKQLQVGPEMNPGGDRGSFFQKLLNFLSSKDQQKFNKDGKIIHTNTFQATPSTEFLGITNVDKSHTKPTLGRKINQAITGDYYKTDEQKEYAKAREKEKLDNLGLGGDVPKEEDNSEALLDKKLDFLKGLNEEQLEAAFMMKGVELAGKFGEGGMRAADSYDNLTRSIAAIAGALPQYKNPGFTISPMAYQNYAFGRG